MPLLKSVENTPMVFLLKYNHEAVILGELDFFDSFSTLRNHRWCDCNISINYSFEGRLTWKALFFGNSIHILLVFLLTLVFIREKKERKSVIYRCSGPWAFPAHWLRWWNICDVGTKNSLLCQTGIGVHDHLSIRNYYYNSEHTVWLMKLSSYATLCSSFNSSLNWYYVTCLSEQEYEP